MTTEEMDGLWELIGIFRKNDPHLKDKKLKNAWLLVLEPYERDDVRNAVAAYFRECGYWPDVTDIAKRCPPLPAPAYPPEAPTGEDQRALNDLLTPAFREMLERRRAAGVPATYQEAEAAGMNFDLWDEQLREAGLQMDWRRALREKLGVPERCTADNRPAAAP